MAQIFIKPAAGLKVRHVERLDYFLPEAGEWVEDHTLWQRRINEGDVLLVDSPEKPQSNSVSKENKIATGDKA